MKKVKNNRIKNTGILFELLVRQTTSDILHNVTESKAAPLIRKYFNKNTELSKELELYQSLVNEKFNSENKASSFVDLVIEARKKLNNTQLRRDKYNLIKEINTSFNVDDFFKARINDYRVLGSIYMMFENTLNNFKPADLVQTRYNIIEHVLGTSATKTSSALNEVVDDSYAKQDKEIRMLTYKLLVEKFNKKYNGLDERQKSLLEKYITNISNTTSLKEYVSSEVTKLQKDIKTLSTNVRDKVIRIKLDEVSSLLNTMKKGKIVKDEEIVSLLKYYELVNELKHVVKKEGNK